MKKISAIRSYLFLVVLIAIAACKQQDENPVVQAVYPSSEVVPENLLRMYIQFSRPMKTIGNLEKIVLIDDKGNEVENVFFNNVYELWNEEQTQLTLILDPARVKTGLRANETHGRAIQPYKSYTLIVEDLEDVYHRKMEAPFKKRISVESADLQTPDIDQWKLNVPKSDSRSSFSVEFPQMLDYNSLKQRLIITDSENIPVKGIVSIEDQETEWRFQPESPWEEGTYILHVNTRLEDPAGNNLNGLFDHKIGSLKNKHEGEMESILLKIE